MSTAAAMSEFARGFEAQHGGRPAVAISAYQAAVSADPELAAAHFNLGQLLRERGEAAAAAIAFEAAARLRPGAADAWLNLGLCHENLGHLQVALEFYGEAGRLEPNGATAWFNQGNVLRKLDHLVAAATAFERARAVAPEVPETWLNLGNVLRELGRLDEAAEILTHANALRPSWPEARWNLALTELGLGRLAEGWTGYESRFAMVGTPDGTGLGLPRWTGQPLAGRRLLVWREQGLGDEILFATCVPDLVARGAQVTLVADPRLVGLHGRAFPAARVVAEMPTGRQDFDYQVPLGSLPLVLRRTRTDFRSRWSHLVPTRDQMVRWATRLSGLGPGLRIGVCWRSGMAEGERRRYYPALSDWHRLFELPGVTFVNLQYDDCAADIQQIESASGARLHRWDDVDLKNDLEAVAGLIWHLDLVVTAPTAVSSLAGALGTETWQVDAGTDWTALGELRSPWLPAIRVFPRPPGERSWSAVFDGLTDALHPLAGVAAPVTTNEGK